MEFWIGCSVIVRTKKAACMDKFELKCGAT